jgi:hypothetical protein
MYSHTQRVQEEFVFGWYLRLDPTMYLMVLWYGWMLGESTIFLLTKCKCVVF